MNKRCYIIILAILFLVSCAKTKRQDIVLKTDDPDGMYFEVQNTGRSMAVFTISMHGINVLSEDAVNKTIDTIYGNNMPEAEKVWRFISEYTLHQGLITPQSWLYDPVLLINSGGSLCGFRSAVMTNLLLLRGERARSWGINGHVVTEVYNRGSWQLYDPDLGVVYYNTGGKICSYAELCGNSRYITNPSGITSISGVCDSIQATSEHLAEKYTSTSDNTLFNTLYPEDMQGRQWIFTLPPGAILSFPVTDSAMEKTSLAVLKIPLGWTGTLRMPLIPYDHSTGAELRLGSHSPDGSHDAWAACLSEIDHFDGSIEVVGNPRGVVIRFYINPIVYMPQPVNRITVEGKHVNDIRVSLKPRGDGVKPATKSPCNENYEYWNSLLNDCHGFDTLQVETIEDYMGKIRVMQQCSCFLAAKLDTAVINRQVVELAGKYDSESRSVFKEFNSREGFLYSWVQILQTLGYAQ